MEINFEKNLIAVVVQCILYIVLHNWVGVLDNMSISLPISGTNRTNVRKLHSYLLQKIMHVIMYYN